MDNAALGRLIDRGNERAHLVGIGLGGAACPLLHATQTRNCTPIAKCSAHILAGAFGGRFGIGHDLKIVGEEVRGAARHCQDAERARFTGKIDNYACGIFCATTALLCGGFWDGFCEERAELIQLSDGSVVTSVAFEDLNTGALGKRSGTICT